MPVKIKKFIFRYLTFIPEVHAHMLIVKIFGIFISLRNSVSRIFPRQTAKLTMKNEENTYFRKSKKTHILTMNLKPEPTS